MDWITDDIAIGNYLDAQNADLLRGESISAVLGLSADLRGRNPEELGLKAIEIVSLEDAPGNDPRLFARAVSCLARLRHEFGRVLVHCHAGRSRSVVVVAGHLMQSLQITADDALARVAAKREVSVTEGLERLLEAID
jgi:protein-tyrosine phosphatase